MNNTGGKGSAPRPIGVNKETFSSNWDAIFGKKTEKSIAEIYEEIKEFSKEHPITLVSTKTRAINNPDFTNDAEGWKSDGKTHVINPDVYYSNHKPDLYLYLVKEVTKEVFDTSTLITIAAKDDFDAISFYPGYGSHEGKEYQTIIIGKALPSMSEGIVKL